MVVHTCNPVMSPWKVEVGEWLAEAGLGKNLTLSEKQTKKQNDLGHCSSVRVLT
jgi:hypothetical protein